MYLGMFSLLDPARPEVPDAVLKARRAQIRVAMVTGDHPTTATAIAKKVHILSKDISIDNGLDSFKIQSSDETRQPVALLMRNEDTLLETHMITEPTTTIEVKGMKLVTRVGNKPNIFKRIWTRFMFYLKDPNEIKTVDKLQLIPYGVVVAGANMHLMDVSVENNSWQLNTFDLFSRITCGIGFCLIKRLFLLEHHPNKNYALLWNFPSEVK